MQLSYHLAANLVLVTLVPQLVVAADKPSDLIVGKWKDRAVRDDAVIEFSKDGTGSITETTPKQTTSASISWTVKGNYGNACILVIKYVQPKGAKPLPKEAKPMTWLVAFDGENSFISQPQANTIVFMDRQK